MLEELRKKLGLTKAEMIEALDITKSYYSMIIKGERPISKNLALKIHEKFDIPLETIFFEKTVHGTKTRVG